jgi:hypothetical protein
MASSPTTVEHFAQKSILKASLAALVCLFLTGCVFLPGEFQSHLIIRNDHTFSFTYHGELVWAKYEKPPAACVADADRVAGDLTCQCTSDKYCDSAAESARLATLEAKRSGIVRISRFDPFDNEANKEMARQLTSYSGWKRAEYKGNGVFDVEYEMAGKFEQDIVFPALPQTSVMVPFLTVRKLKGICAETVEIDGPALLTDQLRKDIEILTGDSDLPFFERTKGVFRITTDADVQTSNGNLKADVAGSTIEWRIDQATGQFPHAQLCLAGQG